MKLGQTKLWLALCISGLAASSAGAQPATRQLTTVLGTAPDSFVGPITTLSLKRGGILVNETFSGRLLLLDSALRATPVDPSSTGGFGNVIRFRADSALAMETRTGSFVVIDPAGAVVRAMAMPRSAFDGRTALLGYDQAGRFVVRGQGPVYLTLVPPEFEGDTVLAGPDSLPISRVDLPTRVQDTIAFLRAPTVRQLVSRVGGRGSGRPVVNPLPGGDDVALLIDGTIAIVRQRDYHVDWISPDGQRTSSAVLPGTWMRLTDSLKSALVDSARNANVGTGRGRGGVTRYVEPALLPDSVPPFITGQTRSDSDGNLWVRLRRAAPQGAAVYDIVDRKGVVIDRVQLPAGTTLVGFAPGVVLVTSAISRTASQLMTIKLR